MNTRSLSCIFVSSSAGRFLWLSADVLAQAIAPCSPCRLWWQHVEWSEYLVSAVPVRAGCRRAVCLARGKLACLCAGWRFSNRPCLSRRFSGPTPALFWIVPITKKLYCAVGPRQVGMKPWKTILIRNKLNVYMLVYDSTYINIWTEITCLMPLDGP